MVLIRTLTVSTTAFDRTKEKFYGLRQTEQVKVILVYRNAHHAKSSPGNETFLYGMTMHHLWVANFLAFLSWKKDTSCSIYRCCLDNTSLQINSSAEQRAFSVIIPTPASASKPGFSRNTFLAVFLVCFDVNDVVSHCFTAWNEISLPKTIEFSFRSVERSSRNRWSSNQRHPRLFSLRLMFDRSKLESLRDVSVTRIGDEFSYGFPQTGDEMFDHSSRKMFIGGLSWNTLTHFPLLVNLLIR